MDTDKKNPIQEPADRSCDVKTWQGSCLHEEVEQKGEKYLCKSCGKISGLDHEIHHEHFPHISGDHSKMH
jgi:hypothetical protein